MLIPELPTFLTGLGGAEHKGLIVALFTLTAMISRPFSGKLADSVGRVPVIIFGSIVCMICSLMYPILTTVFGFFVLRFFHGFSTGFTPTGQSTYVSDVIPLERRGEAMGLLATLGSVGMAMGPGMGDWITFHFGLNVMFYVSSAFGLLAALLVMGLKETLPAKKSFSLSVLKISRSDLFEPKVWLPCVIMGLSAYAFGAMLTLLPDFAMHVGIERKGQPFIYFTLSSLFIRLIAGRASDKYGRVNVMIIAAAIIMISMLIVASSTTKFMFLAGVILYGFGQGSVGPTLLAWAADLSVGTHRGRALASVYIFMELGIGLGAYVSGWIFGVGSTDFFMPFAVSGALAGVALVILLTRPLFTKS